MKTFFIFLLISLSSFVVFGQKTAEFQMGKDYKSFLKEPLIKFNQDTTVLDDILYHPTLNEYLNEKEKEIIRKKINERKKTFAIDTVGVSDIFWIFKPYFEALLYEDPHYRVAFFPIITNKKFKENDIRVIPAEFLLINDTVLVSKSLCPELEVGDMILAFNGIPISDVLAYNYHDRYVLAYVLQQYYKFSFFTSYKIELLRNNKKETITISGHPYSDNRFAFGKENLSTKKFPEYNAGYIALNHFYPNNSVLIKTLRKFILQSKKEGCTNVIIDLRRNSGGNGHNFDKLMSIFIDKPVVLNLESKRIKVSEPILKDYKWFKDYMLGEVTEVPEKFLIKEFNTIPQMYVEGINYYVLISKNTGSIAATFANLLNYNEAATLIGEPLLHNALKYGETITAWWAYHMITFISTAEMNEYTHAKDGVLYPDVLIPYSARDYISGKDHMLEKALELIKTNNNNTAL